MVVEHIHKSWHRYNGLVCSLVVHNDAGHLYCCPVASCHKYLYSDFMKNTGMIKPSVGAIVFKGPDVLLIKRGNAPLKGRWSIPGGKIEFGETLEAALRREVREETGIEVELVGLINVFEALPQEDRDGHYLMVDYVARWASGDVVAGDDADAAEFVSFSEALDRLSWDKTRTALQQAKQALEKAEEREGA